MEVLDPHSLPILLVHPQLNRSLQRHHQNYTDKVSATAVIFPKKAFAKLCNQALDETDYKCGPWIRPDDEHAPDGGYAHAIQNRNCSSYDNSLISSRNFDPKMKKSLYQLDTFLMEACTSSEIDVTDKYPGDEAVTANATSIPTNEEDDQVADSSRGLADAYALFCRREDSDNLVAPSAISQRDNGQKAITVPNAAKLGQYFASDENAKDVGSEFYNDITILPH